MNLITYVVINMSKLKNNLINEIDLDIEKLKKVVDDLEKEVNTLKVNNMKKEIIIDEINEFVKENELK